MFSCLQVLPQMSYKFTGTATQLAKLTLSTLVDPNAPHTSFPLCRTKGQETEYLCLALQEVWAEHCDAHDSPHCLLQLC